MGFAPARGGVVDLSGLVTVEVEKLDAPPVAIVRVRGELDFGTTPRLIEALDGLPDPGQSLVFDLSELHFCDSSGLGALIAAHKATRAGGGRVHLAGVTPIVRTAIHVTSLDQLFPLHETVEAALAEVYRA
jgi:anti-anti-sigma factor